MDLEVARCALQLRRVHEARGREAVDGEVRRGVHARTVLQVRDPLAQTVEIGDEGVAGVALTFAPAVAGDLEGAAVAQDGLGGEGRLAQQVPDDFRGELGLDEVVDAGAFGAGGHREVPRVQRSQVVGPQEAAVRLCLGPGVAPDAQGGLVAQDGVADQRRLEEQVPHDAGRELLLDQVPDLPRLCTGSSDEVPGVPRRLVQEAGAGDLGVHLGGGVVVEQRYVDLVDDRGLELRPAHVDAHQPGDGVRYFLVRLGRGVVGREVRAARHGVGDGLVGFGPRVEVQQGRDDLVVDLAAAVVARRAELMLELTELLRSSTPRFGPSTAPAPRR